MPVNQRVSLNGISFFVVSLVSLEKNNKTMNTEGTEAACVASKAVGVMGGHELMDKK